MKEKSITLFLLTGILVLGSAFLGRLEQEQAVNTMGSSKTLPVVVIDSGHGGRDPGKVGVNGVLEKDINLSIALRLQRLLEQNDIAVVMTREEDKDLAAEQAANRKTEDLRARAALVKESGAAVFVSIHQNSYPEADVAGAQVFYFSDSEEGKQLGKIVQESLKSELADGNHRVAKANRDYYLLKKAICPAIIVECGFLSNQTEAELLATEEYQEKIAFAIHLGIMEYINTTEIVEDKK